MATAMRSPNAHGVTLDSGPTSFGCGVLARLRAPDGTEIRRRWIVVGTEEEADRVARSLADADWEAIVRWPPEED